MLNRFNCIWNALCCYAVVELFTIFSAELPVPLIRGIALRAIHFRNETNLFLNNKDCREVILYFLCLSWCPYVNIFLSFTDIWSSTQQWWSSPALLVCSCSRCYQCFLVRMLNYINFDSPWVLMCWVGPDSSGSSVLCYC